MKALLSLFVSAFLLVACSSAPKPLALLNNEWILEPTNADENLRKDEQFLKKAQTSQDEKETASLRSRYRPLLRP